MMNTTVCIAGKNEIAVRALEWVRQNFPEIPLRVVANKTDTGFNTWQPSLRYFAGKWGVPVVSLFDVYPIENLLFISLEFDAIIKPHLFASPQLFNIHFSALPKYKGMYTSVHPLLHGEKESGVTLHCIDPGIDTGDILDQIIFPIGNETTGRAIYQLYLDHAFLLFQKNFQKLLDKSWTAVPQSETGGSYYSRSSLNFAQLTIDYNKTAWEIANQFRAFHFRDYQMPQFNGWEIAATEIIHQKSKGKPGQIEFEDDQAFEISTIDYNIRLIKDYYARAWAAAEEGNLDSLKKFRPFLPDLDLRNRHGWSLLIIAVYQGHKEMASWLIGEGASVEITNYKGTTLPMYALGRYQKWRDDDMLHWMKQWKVDWYQADDQGKTILEYAPDENSRNIILDAMDA